MHIVLSCSILYNRSMKKSSNSDVRTGRHCVFNLHVHLVFVAKYRKPVFSRAILTDLNTIFSNICTQFQAKLVEFNGESGHVHLLINYPPTVQLFKLVNSLRGVSSRILRKKHVALLDAYWKDVLWSPSYFACSCGGAPISIIRQYIEQQAS